MSKNKLNRTRNEAGIAIWSWLLGLNFWLRKTALFLSFGCWKKLSVYVKIRPKIGLYLPNKNGPMGKNGLVQIGLLFIHIGREKRPITQQFFPSRLCGGDRHPDDHATIFKLPSWQSFSHHIGTIVICMNLFKLKQLRNSTHLESNGISHQCV